MTNSESGASTETEKPSLSRFATKIAVLMLTGALLSACVVYPVGYYPHPHYYGGYYGHRDWR